MTQRHRLTDYVDMLVEQKRGRDGTTFVYTLEADPAGREKVTYNADFSKSRNVVVRGGPAVKQTDAFHVSATVRPGDIVMLCTVSAENPRDRLSVSVGGTISMRPAGSSRRDGGGRGGGGRDSRFDTPRGGGGPKEDINALLKRAKDLDFGADSWTIRELRQECQVSVSVLCFLHVGQ